MDILFRVYLFTFFLSTALCFNFTYKMATKCKEHVCQHGAFYDTFYKINREKLKLGPGIDFEMHIAILAPSNGHILLSPEEYPTANSPVYEIVVGGGANKFSEIRRNKGKNAKKSAKTIDILSPIHFTAFFIIFADGTLEIGKENESLPLLSYHDTDPLTINYFSFASWQGVEAKFLYDCPAPGSDEEEEETPDSTMVEVELTNVEKLKRMLLNERSSYSPPDPEVTVDLECVVTSIKYDAFEAKLVTGLDVTLRWIDETLAWNPSKFNETSILKFRHGEIWRPYFMVKNGLSLDALDSKTPEPIYFVHKGKATLHFQTEITTWCYDASSYLSNWPRDEYECSIVIVPWAYHETINMRISNFMNKGLSDLNDVIENEWSLYKTTNNVVLRNSTEHNLTNDQLQISLFIRRHALPYNVVFYTPLLVLVTFLLLSFWTQPLAMSRVWFYTGCVSVMCMGLAFIEYLVPTHTLPSIVILYTCVLMGNLIALLTQVILMHPFVMKHYKNIPIEIIISNSFLRTLCCLKYGPTHSDSVAYETMNVQSNDIEDHGLLTSQNNREEMQSENTMLVEGDEFADVVDKLMFLVYSIVFAILLALHY